MLSEMKDEKKKDRTNKRTWDCLSDKTSTNSDIKKEYKYSSQTGYSVASL